MEEQIETTVELTEGDRPSGWLLLPTTDGPYMVVRVADIKYATEGEGDTTRVVILSHPRPLSVGLSIVDFYGHLTREA